MLKSAAQRRELILELVNKEGSVQVSRLAEICEVTPVTIRVDLTSMEKEGLLYRVHGSAMSKNPVAPERSTRDKRMINAAVKSRIGIAASGLVEAGDDIFLASGSTMLAFCEELLKKANFTVFTTSIQVAALMSANPDISVHMLGGVVRFNSQSVRGEYSKGVLQSINTRLLFLGADGIDEQYGITCSTVEEALFMQEIFETSMKIVLLCDSSKIGKHGVGRICKLDRIDVVITDDAIPQTYMEMFQQNGVEVITVPSE